MHLTMNAILYNIHIFKLLKCNEPHLYTYIYIKCTLLPSCTFYFHIIIIIGYEIIRI